MNKANKANKAIRVKAFPSSKKEKLVQSGDYSFDIYVREPAQNNLANTRVRELIAKHFVIPKERVIIKTGHRARKKLLTIVPEKS